MCSGPIWCQPQHFHYFFYIFGACVVMTLKQWHALQCLQRKFSLSLKLIQSSIIEYDALAALCITAAASVTFWPLSRTPRDHQISMFYDCAVLITTPQPRCPGCASCCRCASAMSCVTCDRGLKLLRIWNTRPSFACNWLRWQRCL